MVKAGVVRRLCDPLKLITEALASGPKTTSEIEQYIRHKAQCFIDELHPEYNFMREEDKQKKIAEQIPKYCYSDRQIRDYCRKLQGMGDIEQEGEKGPYFLSDDYFDNPKFTLERIGHRVLDILSRKGIAGTREDTNNHCRLDFIRGNLEEKLLFDFIIKSGSIIADVMLEAMAPKPAVSKGEEKTNLAKMYVRRAINVEKMMIRFRNLLMIKDGVIHPYPGLTDSEPPKLADESWSSLELDEQEYKRLRKAFTNLEPGISTELSKIRTKMVPKEIVAHKELYKKFLREHKRKQMK